MQFYSSVTRSLTGATGRSFQNVSRVDGINPISFDSMSSFLSCGTPLADDLATAVGTPCLAALALRLLSAWALLITEYYELTNSPSGLKR